MYLLGIDLGTSSVKATVVDAQSQKIVASAQFPEVEAEIISLQPGWAEQSPADWWTYVQKAILACHQKGGYDPRLIKAIGIAYQMHGLVTLDKDQNVIRNAIIWCDSRAVSIGEDAFQKIGKEKCLHHLLNSPGNFTASKLAWVKQHEPQHYERIASVMLPGDYIALKMTGVATTTASALSEGVFWDFRNNEISGDIINHYGFSKHLIPEVKDVFTAHGAVKQDIAAALGLTAGIPVSYKAGDQPNNALSLQVLEPGEVAATAGTSGVIYGVSDELRFDPPSRINSFAHVNHTAAANRIGILLCINGTGIFNKWIRQMVGCDKSYAALNEEAQKIVPGSDGLMALPFGNGAERMLENKMIGAHLQGIDLNKHSSAHLVRSVQEGIAYSFRYGLDIMRENGMNPGVIRANKTNMFLSEVFTSAFADVTGVCIEFYEGDGSFGAAIGAGMGAGIYKNSKEAFSERKPIGVFEPKQISLYNDLYHRWKKELDKHLY
ncbi:MAG: xylulokinase [Chitinophagaceae bacterium]